MQDITSELIDCHLVDDDPTHNFDIFDLTASDALTGQTFTLDSGPLFQNFARFMTDGREGDLVFELRSGGGSGGYFSRKSNFAPGSLNGVDLQGFIIDGCDLRIDYYEDLGQRPSGLYWSRTNFTLTIRGWTAAALQATRAALTQIILFGTEDPCGVAGCPGSGPVSEGPWGWTSLSPADQEALTALALRQATKLLTRLPDE
jgi:hypothetical protein